MIRLLLAGSVAVLAPVGLAAQAGRGTPAGWQSFVRLFDARADSAHIVGAAAVWVQDGRVVARHEHGLADRSRDAPVTGRTLFHYGSITKTLTAIAVMQLRDRGRLSLDDPVVRWVPELRRLHDPYGRIDSITVRMLLSHTAGFQAPTWPYRRGEAWEPFEPTSWEQLVAMMPYQELTFRPGSRFGYSNPGYVYLARVIEAVTGDPWATYVQKNLFAPLALDRSSFGATPYYLAPDRSHNYSVVRDSATGIVAVRDNGADFDPGITIPNSGWNAPLDDLATYAAFLTDADGGDAERRRRYEAVLSRASLEEMWEPVTSAAPVGDRSQSVGLGFFVIGRGRSRVVGHTGSQAGFRAFLWFRPATRSAIVVALNTEVLAAGIPEALGPIQAAALALLDPDARGPR